jgi:PPOX class probable F420-dependent enzyme
MNRRDAIRLTEEEQRRFLADSKTIILSTIDPRGYPHAVPMWYVMEGEECLMTTYGKSQKTMNVRRDPRVSLLVEAGETYDTLKGVLIRGRASVIDDVDACVGVLTRVHRKMLGAMPPGIEAALELQARKRVVIRVTPEHVSSWDHAKLAGVY